MHSSKLPLRRVVGQVGTWCNPAVVVMVVVGCGNRKEMNATLAAMVNEISEKMKQQKEEKTAHCAENDRLRQQIEVTLISRL